MIIGEFWFTGPVWNTNSGQSNWASLTRHYDSKEEFRNRADGKPKGAKPIFRERLKNWLAAREPLAPVLRYQETLESVVN